MQTDAASQTDTFMCIKLNMNKILYTKIQIGYDDDDAIAFKQHLKAYGNNSVHSIF